MKRKWYTIRLKAIAIISLALILVLMACWFFKIQSGRDLYITINMLHSGDPLWRRLVTHSLRPGAKLATVAALCDSRCFIQVGPFTSAATIGWASSDLIAKDGVILYAESTLGERMTKVYFDTMSRGDKIDFTRRADEAGYIFLSPFKASNMETP